MPSNFLNFPKITPTFVWVAISPNNEMLCISHSPQVCANAIGDRLVSLKVPNRNLKDAFHLGYVIRALLPSEIESLTVPSNLLEHMSDHNA
jgi:hypothetical protein